MDNIDILLRLLIAHLLADFLFQSNAMAREKKKGPASAYFRWHIFIVGITTYVLLGQWANLKGPLLITIIHGIIDATKASLERKAPWAKSQEMRLFLADQALHLLTLIGYWLIISGIEQTWLKLSSIFVEHVAQNVDVLLVTSAYLIVIGPTGFLIGFMTKKWREEIEEDDQQKAEKDPESFENDQYSGHPEIAGHQLTQAKPRRKQISFFQDFIRRLWKRKVEVEEEDREEVLSQKKQTPKEGRQTSQEGLKDAGRTIGIIERSLILTFILMSQYQAIGFLIAAKSVFRFGDLIDTSQRKRTEYILIGTLISFTFSILLGISTQFLIDTL